MKRLTIVLVLLYYCTIVPSLSQAAVGVDISSSNACQSCSTLTISHAVAGGATLLVCSVSPEGGDTSGITWNTVSSMSPVATIDSSGGILSMWSLASPTAGTHNVVITLTGAVDSLAAGCTSFTGAGTIGTAVTDGNYSPSAILNGASITVPTDGMAFGAGFYSQGADCTTNENPDTGNTETYDVCSDNGPGHTVAAFAVTRTTTGTVNWTNHPSGVWEAIIGVPINPSIATVTVKHRPVMQ